MLVELLNQFLKIDSTKLVQADPDAFRLMTQNKGQFFT